MVPSDEKEQVRTYRLYPTCMLHISQAIFRKARFLCPGWNPMVQCQE